MADRDVDSRFKAWHIRIINIAQFWGQVTDMSKSTWFTMAAGAILATGLGIMVIQTYSDGLFASNTKAVGYPVDAETEASGTAKGPELLPDWGTLFGDPAKLAEYQTKGATVTKVCASCHDLSPAGANKTGPGLADVVGRAAGSKAGFGYSDGMKALGKSWSLDELDAFLHNPKKLVSGTTMSFAGLTKTEDRIAAVAYLRSISPGAPALPAADPTRDPAQVAAAAASAAPAAGAAATNAVATNAVAAPVNAVAAPANAVAAPKAEEAKAAMPK